jgi:RimJ/RimL family protein N-acetyltransferase
MYSIGLQRLTLEPCDPSDAVDLARMLSDLELRQALQPDAGELSAGAHLEWIQPTCGIRCGVVSAKIIHAAARASIGVIRCELGELSYFLDRQMWGQGFAGEALAGFCDFLRQTYGGVQVCAVTTRNNLRSMRLLERHGFRYSGLARQRGSRTASYSRDLLYTRDLY